MTEPGVAALLGWDQTVNAAWDQLAAGQAPPGGITLEVLRKVMPNLPEDKAREYLPHLNSAMAEAGITTPKRQAAFLAQIAHESIELTDFVENGRRAYFDKYEPGTEIGENLGNTQPGDGYRYRGRGAIQLTGRDNYRRAGTALNLPLEEQPDRADDPDVAFRTAGWFWNSKDLNEYADAENFREITRRINGGTNGLEKREEYYAAAKEALGI